VAKDLIPAVICTKAHQRTEMRLDVMLSNSVAGGKQLMRCRPLLHDVNDNEPQQIIVGEGRCCRSFTLQLLAVTVTFLSSDLSYRTSCVSACL